MANVKLPDKPKAKNSTPFIDEVLANMPKAKVFVRCTTGVLPLEWPRFPVGHKFAGQKMIDYDDLVSNGHKLVRVGGEKFRSIVTRIVNEQGVGAQSAGYMELFPEDPTTEQHGETDAQFLERIKDWIKNSGDPRIAKHGVSVEEGSPFPIPFANWDDVNADVIFTTVQTAFLGDSFDENMNRLRMFARYELSKIPSKDRPRHKPRRAVLEALEMLAGLAGDESGDDTLVVDES